MDTAADPSPPPPSQVAAATPTTRASSETRHRHKVTLRSSPSGADVMVDGRPAGTAPLIFEVPADAQVHEFTFTLPGHEIARYRFPVTRDGVVHGTLKPLSPPDAGP